MIVSLLSVTLVDVSCCGRLALSPIHSVLHASRGEECGSGRQKEGPLVFLEKATIPIYVRRMCWNHCFCEF